MRGRHRADGLQPVGGAALLHRHGRLVVAGCRDGRRRGRERGEQRQREEGQRYDERAHSQPPHWFTTSNVDRHGAGRAFGGGRITQRRAPAGVVCPEGRRNRRGRLGGPLSWRACQSWATGNMGVAAGLSRAARQRSAAEAVTRPTVTRRWRCSPSAVPAGSDAAWGVPPRAPASARPCTAHPIATPRRQDLLQERPALPSHAEQIGVEIHVGDGPLHALANPGHVVAGRPQHVPLQMAGRLPSPDQG